VRRSSTLSFASGATISAALAAVALVLGLRGVASDTSAWAMAGFVAMALPVIAAGVWLAYERGRAGVSFVVALGAGLLMRAALLVVVVAGAAHQGEAALIGALVGLAVGFVPVTAFELVWFARRAHGVGPQTEWRG